MAIILRLVGDPDVRDSIKFLREREVIHFQRFGEALPRAVHLNLKNVRIGKAAEATALPLFRNGSKTLYI